MAVVIRDIGCSLKNSQHTTNDSKTNLLTWIRPDFQKV